MIRKRLIAPSPQLARAAMSLILLFGLTTVTANAQTYSVIHNFAGGGGGAIPYGGLTIDQAGNLYGTTGAGGTNRCYLGLGCGTIFKLKNVHGQFSFEPLYSFLGDEDGASPAAPLLIAPNGIIYGSTEFGGDDNCSCQDCDISGCGTVFSLQPPPMAPRNIQDSFWHETILHSFRGSDGIAPQGTLAVDNSGSLYGSTSWGGSTQCFNGCGVVFQLAQSSGGWNVSVLHEFVESNDGWAPLGGVNLDAAGNVYGTTFSGPGSSGYGTVWQLLAGSNWQENILYTFTNGSDGSDPTSGLTFDASGNLYGNNTGNAGGVGVGFELSSGSWAFNLLYSFGTGIGPHSSPLIFDGAGNLYGTTYTGGAYSKGSVFKLTPSLGGWSYTSLHDFCPASGCGDGAYPTGNIVMDSNGNLYGTTINGGQADEGVVWEITP
jgi:uncharacterized repeat protein (TIGR03803 family)